MLSVNGVLYVTAPDNVWALDAQDGRELWHYFWRTRAARTSATAASRCGGTTCSSSRRTTTSSRSTRAPGKERWHKEIATFSQQYFLTSAPIVVGNHVIVGTGNDLDSPGYLQSFDPETGDLQWKWYAVPMNPGDPGLETVEESRRGAQRRRPSVAAGRLRSGDAALYLRHRQPDAGLHVGAARRGSTTSTPARSWRVNVDTGKMAWYYQTSPHDTHDWDSAQTPVLVDGDDQRHAAQAGA